MMQFEGVAGLFGVLAIISLFIGYKLLASSGWIGGWIRGNFGIACVLLTGMLVLCVIDIRSYKPMFDDMPVATLSFQETSPKHYDVRLVDAAGVENRYTISGDQWSLTANQFKWSKRLSMGLGHGYRFRAIKGQYLQSQNAASEDTISVSRYVDVWSFVHHYLPSNFFASAETILSPSQPLVDAAMYEVVPLGSELVVRPLNEFAKRAQSGANQSGVSPVVTPAETATTSEVIAVPATEVVAPIEETHSTVR